MQNNIQLHDYQIVAKNFLINHPKAGLFLDVGFGKTITTLMTLVELAQNRMIGGHILIIAPKAIARSTWVDEMEKWGLKANTVSLIVNNKGKQLSKAKRIALYEAISTTPPAFYFINREMILDLVYWHLDNKKPWPFPTVVIDELQSFKSYSSERFKALKQVLPYIKRFIGLTGTPTPNGIMDLWAEIYLMDEGARLGKNITEYRNTFFTPGLVMNNVTVTWNPKIGAEDEIYDRIKDLVISVQNPNLQLPQVTYNDVICYMTDEETQRYKEFVKEQILEFTDNASGVDLTVQASNAGVMSMRLSQMASGTVYVEADDTINKADVPDYVVLHTHKLEQLSYIIDNTGDNILVAYHFKSDKDQICKYLHSLKYDVRVFDGSPEMIHAWNAGQIRIMLLQPQAAGHGINIQEGGHTLVWYTLPWSLEDYIQTCGRLNRQGQRHPVMIHHLMTQGTIDKRILKALKDKDASERALIEAVSATIDDAIVP